MCFIGKIESVNKKSGFVWYSNTVHDGGNRQDQGIYGRIKGGNVIASRGPTWESDVITDLA